MSRHDKVLNLVRETMLHENVLERLTFECRQRCAVLEFWQPDPVQAWPDMSLELTFMSVVSWNLQAAPDHPDFAGEVTTFTCERVGEWYRAHLTTQAPGGSACHLDLTFADLQFARGPR